MSPAHRPSQHTSSPDPIPLTPQAPAVPISQNDLLGALHIRPRQRFIAQRPQRWQSGSGGHVAWVMLFAEQETKALRHSGRDSPNPKDKRSQEPTNHPQHWQQNATVPLFWGATTAFTSTKLLPNPRNYSYTISSYNNNNYYYYYHYCYCCCYYYCYYTIIYN